MGADYSGLKEMRDLREVQTLLAFVQKLNEDLHEEAIDILAQRAKAILIAKSAKGSWEKGQVVELVSTGLAIIPQGEITLSGLGAAPGA